MRRDTGSGNAECVLKDQKTAPMTGARSEVKSISVLLKFYFYSGIFFLFTFAIADIMCVPGDELRVAAEHLVPRGVVDHEEVGVVPVEGDVVAPPDLLVGVVAHLVELVGVGVDEEVVVLDVTPYVP